MNALSIFVFAAGWLIFVFGQAHNSLLSNSNGLNGWQGAKIWLKAQAANLVTRAFFSAVFAGWIIQSVTEKMQSAGLQLHSYAVTALAGFAANALLYQVLGLFPWLRVEVGELAPPPTSPNSSQAMKQ